MSHGNSTHLHKSQFYIYSLVVAKGKKPGLVGLDSMEWYLLSVKWFIVYLLRISINLQVFYILGACSSAQILSVSSWPHPVVYYSFRSCIAHKMKWYLCTKDWPTKALLNSDVWTLHMHVCLPLIYFKPPPSVLLSACECHEVSASWFACLVCARQENRWSRARRINPF